MWAFTTSLSRLARLQRTYGGGGGSRVSTTWIPVDMGADAGTGAGGSLGDEGGGDEAKGKIRDRDFRAGRVGGETDGDGNNVGGGDDET